MRAVLNDIRESLFRDFKDRIEEKDEIDETLFVIDEIKMAIKYIPTGNIIISKGFKKSSGSHSAKLKSIAGATHVIIEECEEISEEDFRTLDVSLRTIKAKPQIIRIFNSPDQNHWLIKNHYNLTPVKTPGTDAEDSYFIATPKKDDQLLSIFSTYITNYENLDKTFSRMLESYKDSDPDYYYTMVKGYVSSGKRGRIFKNYQLYKELPDRPYYRVLGLDFGYNPDPTAIEELNIFKDKKEIYIRELHREIEMQIGDIATAIEKDNAEEDETICDNAEPREIVTMQGYGLNVIKSRKPPNRTAGRYLLKGWKIFLHEDSTDLHEEFEKHTWALDANKNPMNKPIDGWDHGIDASIYGLNYYTIMYGYEN
jgi:phage terminase large subunit